MVYVADYDSLVQVKLFHPLLKCESLLFKNVYKNFVF